MEGEAPDHNRPRHPHRSALRVLGTNTGHAESCSMEIARRIVRSNFVRVIRAACRLHAYSMGLVASLWIGGCGGVFTGIPELDTTDGRVFAQRCSACHGQPFGDHGLTHGVPDPRFRTTAEWQEVLPRMERLMHEKGLSPLTDLERQAINRYLSRHAKP